MCTEESLDRMPEGGQRDYYVAWCNSQKFAKPLTGLVAVSFLFLLFKLFLACLYCCCADNPCCAEPSAFLSLHIALLLYCAVLIYGSQCYLGGSAQGGVLVTVGSWASASFHIGFGPAFFTVLFASFLMTASTVLCCCTTCCWAVRGIGQQAPMLDEQDGRVLELKTAAPPCRSPFLLALRPTRRSSYSSRRLASARHGAIRQLPGPGARPSGRAKVPRAVI